MRAPALRGILLGYPRGTLITMTLALPAIMRPFADSGLPAPHPGQRYTRVQDYRCRADHLRALFTRTPLRGPIAAEFMPMVQLLSRTRAGNFTDIADLKEQACDRDRSAPSASTIRAMTDLFLESQNLRLQSLYRTHFKESPPSAGMRHEDKIISLDRLQERAKSIIADVDWQWLSDWLRLNLIGETPQSCLWRLSNFAFPVKEVTFRLTYHCNISCRHCYNNSGPHAKGQRIELNAMRAIVDQMPDAGIGALNLTGGEPFLYPDDLLAIIAAGRAARLSAITILTNGFWATTPEKADETLSRLVAAGFMQEPRDRLQVGAGTYHQEFIEFDRICVLAKSYHRMFGRPLSASFELAPDGNRTATEREIRSRLAAAGATYCIRLRFRTITAVGRARGLAHAELNPFDSPCPSINQIVFDPDGSARPCCGQNNENHGVKIGSLKLHQLRDLVKRMQNDPILQFLARNPISSIFEHVEVERNAGGYAGYCSLCLHALGDVVDKEKLQARLFDRQEFYPFWFTTPPKAGMQ